jgi:hypothetical protein
LTRVRRRPEESERDDKAPTPLHLDRAIAIARTGSFATAPTAKNLAAKSLASTMSFSSVSSFPMDAPKAR